MAITQEMIDRVLAMTNEDQLALNKVLVQAIKTRRHMQSACKAAAFRRGEQVTFSDTKRGRSYQGEVVSVMRTNVRVRCEGTIWSVPAYLLSKV